MAWSTFDDPRASLRGLSVGVSCAVILGCGRPPLGDAGDSGGFTDSGTSSAEVTQGPEDSGPTSVSTSDPSDSAEVTTVTTSPGTETDSWDSSPEGPEWGDSADADWSAVETGPVESGTETGPGDGDCCEVHGDLGCENDEIAACVCASDPYCCDTFWDSLCVEEVESLGCGFCGGTSSVSTSAEAVTTSPETDSWDAGTGGWDDPIPPGDCCEPNEVPWCEDVELAQCVCAQAPHCCDFVWDEECVDLVVALGCGDCGWGTTSATGSTGGGLPDGEPCIDNEMCEGGLCWADDFSANLTCQSSCIPPEGPLGLICDDDQDCCEGFCNLIEPFDVGQCVL